MENLHSTDVLRQNCDLMTQQLDIHVQVLYSTYQMTGSWKGPVHSSDGTIPKIDFESPPRRGNTSSAQGPLVALCGPVPPPPAHRYGGTVVHLLARPFQALCSNPGHQTKCHHVPLGWCGRGGSNPPLGGVPAPCFGLFFLWLWLIQARATNHGDSRRSVVC